MIKNEIKSIFRSKSRIILAAVIVLFITMDAFIVYTDRPDLHPAYAAFLSGGGNVKLIVTAFVPMYAMYICGDSYIREKANGYGAVIISRAGRKKYFRNKQTTAFLVPFGLILTGMVLNLILALLLFHGGQDTAGFHYTATTVQEDFFILTMQRDFFIFEYNHPFTSYILFMILGSVAVGLGSFLCMSVAFVTKKYPVAYLTSFVIWALLMGLGEAGYLYEPFSGYGLYFVIKGAVELAVAVLAAYMAAKYSFIKRKTRKKQH